MKAYKGFSKDMTCRGFQFEEGKTYEEKEAKLCKSGFHACENPLDCFSYYDPGSSVFHEVELEDVDPARENDSKVVAKKITIGGRLSIKGLVDASIQYIMERIDKTKTQTMINSAASNTGNYSAASNTGDYSAASNTGYCSAASNTGDYSAASNTGDYSAASNTGDYSAASNTGNCSAASVSGKQSVALAIGHKSKVKGALGCWIVVSEWAEAPDGEMEIADVQCRKVDGKTIKPDTWYMLKNGVFVEVK